jgi:peptidyl-prolyl cis-trans isomerase SurA
VFYIPGGNSADALKEAQRIRSKIDTCDDLYPFADGLPADRLERTRMPTTQIPSDLALELAWLDEGEVSTSLTRANGQMLVFLMLCERSRGLPQGVTRDQVLEYLQSQRLNEFADGYLKELRADAHIVYAN